ncbi:MAG: sigma-70 family RNA polymerase sigma factor [Bacteroidales bacterium]|nr:sigma-70 family RNA polymerase sigma factor [Bacteroidales bacterium]
MNNLSDKEILNMCRADNSSSYGFNLLVKKYQQKIYWIVRRILINHEDTNDVVQNIFVKVWENINNFREDSKLYTWLYRISTNEALLFLKKKKLKATLHFYNYEHKLINELQDDNFFAGDEIQMKLQKAILSLPVKQKLVFNMKYYDDLKYKEIAEILNTSVGALKASYHFAVKKIEKYIIDN